MYRKVLIPLDGSKRAERIFTRIKPDLAPDATVVLLQVVQPNMTQAVGGILAPGSLETEDAASKAMAYLRRTMRRLSADATTWRCAVVLNDSVAKGIVDFAHRQGTDLIAMYTHDRKGLAKLIMGSIADDVQRRTNIKTKIFKSPELAGVS